MYGLLLENHGVIIPPGNNGGFPTAVFNGGTEDVHHIANKQVWSDPFFG